MNIDSHVHFWKYNKKQYDWIDNTMKTLQQDYLPEHLSLTLKRNDIDGVVAVQAIQSEYDTNFLVELSKTHDVIKGVVAWIDLQADNVEERLQHFSQYPIIKGYRHVVQGEPLDFLARENFRRGVRALKAYNYTYDILIFHYQLQPALDFVRAFPDQPFVVDHCAKPDIRHKNIDEWKKHMQEMARFPNVCCKLSGLFTEANWKEWSPADFYPYLDVVFEAFGADRLLFGSDWPVMLLSGIYVQWKSLLEKYMENFQPEDREKVFGANAIQFYNL
jgi:Predicted metal-dependent hydrolase of the TIM-barrel fold